MVAYILSHPDEFGITEVLKKDISVGVGDIDILCCEKQRGSSVNLIAVEVKDETIDCAAVGQLTRYMVALRVGKMTRNCKGCLIGRAIQRDAMCLAISLGYKVILWTRYGFIEHVTQDVFPNMTSQERWGITKLDYFLHEWFRPESTNRA